MTYFVEDEVEDENEVNCVQKRRPAINMSTTPTFPSTHPLALLNAIVNPPTVCVAEPIPQEKKMFQALTPEKEYLINRTFTIYYNKDRDLEKEFHIPDDPPPTTFEEMRKRLESGKFTLPKDDPERPHYVNVDEILWRDPKKKPDNEGYIAAREKMMALAQEARDKIIVSDPAEGLKALKEFENAKIH